MEITTHDKVFVNDYNEFCTIFGSLSIQRAKQTAIAMKIPFTDCTDCIDINFKSICASVYSDGIGQSFDCWDRDGRYIKTLHIAD